jgi:hypothetical protein
LAIDDWQQRKVFTCLVLDCGEIWSKLRSRFALLFVDYWVSWPFSRKVHCLERRRLRFQSPRKSETKLSGAFLADAVATVDTVWRTFDFNHHPRLATTQSIRLPGAWLQRNVIKATFSLCIALSGLLSVLICWFKQRSWRFRLPILARHWSTSTVSARPCGDMSMIY